MATATDGTRKARRTGDAVPEELGLGTGVKLWIPPVVHNLSHDNTPEVVPEGLLTMAPTDYALKFMQLGQIIEDMEALSLGDSKRTAVPATPAGTSPPLSPPVEILHVCNHCDMPITAERVRSHPVVTCGVDPVTSICKVVWCSTKCCARNHGAHLHRPSGDLLSPIGKSPVDRYDEWYRSWICNYCPNCFNPISDRSAATVGCPLDGCPVRWCGASCYVLTHGSHVVRGGLHSDCAVEIDPRVIKDKFNRVRSTICNACHGSIIAEVSTKTVVSECSMLSECGARWHVTCINGDPSGGGSGSIDEHWRFEHSTSEVLGAIDDEDTVARSALSRSYQRRPKSAVGDGKAKAKAKAKPKVDRVPVAWPDAPSSSTSSTPAWSTAGATRSSDSKRPVGTAAAVAASPLPSGYFSAGWVPASPRDSSGTEFYGLKSSHYASIPTATTATTATAASSNSLGSSVPFAGSSSGGGIKYGPRSLAEFF